MDALEEIRGIYFDECDEFIGLLEGYLAAMGEGRASEDDIHGAFRAVHSIKGGAGAFALTALVEFAHLFEACLDALRSKRIALEDAPIDILLQAGDVLNEQIIAAREGTSAPVAPALIAALQGMSGGMTKKDAQAPATEIDIFDIDDIAPKPVDEAPTAAATRLVTIKIVPDRDLFRRAIDPRTMFRALATLGAVSATCDASAVPSVAAIEPMDCFLTWTVTLDTEQQDEAIVDTLDMFLGDDEFSLEASFTPKAAGPATPASSKLEQLDVAATTDAAAGHEPAANEPAGSPAAAVANLQALQPNAPHAKRAAGGTIRVDLDRIDKLMNLVGEIVITQSMLSERANAFTKRESQAFVDALFSLARQTRELQDNVMAVRAQPVKVVFQRLPRLVRELERTLGKKAHLELAGEDTEVDKTIVEELADPLIHMIRNAMDHGLETPEERQAAGKKADGTIRVSAEHRGSRILICVSDDGRGINRDRLVAKARSRGLIPHEADVSAEEADNLIFHPGLSTAAAVTDVSGRGVGMDVVRRNVEALGGRITVESTPGRGCRFTLGLPLTLAVLDGMIVRAGTERFVFPLSSIVETMQLDENSVEWLPGGRNVLQLRGEIAPLLKLRDLLGIRAIGEEPIVVIVETETVPRLAIAVDEIIGQQQVVVKNLESSFRRVEGVSAATILGDGLVALILDVDALPALSQSGRKIPMMRRDPLTAAS
jgi:two-component system chemotaxis sensor kinase CheA